MYRMMTVFGTRPEAIKLAPLLRAASKHDKVEPIVVSVGQHREMLDQVLQIFDVSPSTELNIFSTRQSLSDITTKALLGVERAIGEYAPDALVVQGDTTTAMAAALSGYYSKVPVVHVEAGLRTGDPYSPFPEEINRKTISQIAQLHLAPTERCRLNLLAEGVSESSIHVTGNTVVDALMYATRSQAQFTDSRLTQIHDAEGPVMLVTAHRRENLGEPMRKIAQAIHEISEKFPELKIVIPMHKNPAVRDALAPVLESRENVTLVEPLSYLEFVTLMERSAVILTDSGGIQEEAPSLNVPVLVMRNTTERPEVLESGAVTLVGTERAQIVSGVAELLTSPHEHAKMSTASNPYGDGHAAERSLSAILRMLESERAT